MHIFQLTHQLLNATIHIVVIHISGIGIYATLNIRYTAHYKEFSELVRMGVPSNKITKIITIETSLHYIYTIILSTILTYMMANIINKIIIDSTGIYLPYKYPYAGITITIFIITLLIISTIILIKNKIIKSTEVITE